MTKICDDTALIPARSQFQDAAAKLVDPQPQILDGRTHYTDSLYDQLVDDLPGRRGHTSDRTPRSLSILWLDAHDLLSDIDITVAQWHPKSPHGHERGSPRPTTPERLHELAEAKWRPQDVPTLNDHTACLQSWVKSIRNLLDPEIFVYLWGHRCPLCAQTHIRRRDNTGTEVTAPALMVHGDQAMCGGCRTTWWPPMLGRLLQTQQAAQCPC